MRRLPRCCDSVGGVDVVVAAAPPVSAADATLLPSSPTPALLLPPAAAAAAASSDALPGTKRRKLFRPLRGDVRTAAAAKCERNSAFSTLPRRLDISNGDVFGPVSPFRVDFSLKY